MIERSTQLAMLCQFLALVRLLPFSVASLIFLIVYSSLHIVSRRWMGLQMHVTIIESNFAYLISLPLGYINPFVPIFTFRFLVWRIMLGCGACKYGTGDKSWRNGTAMNYHYFTQPLPNGLTHFFHRHPSWILSMSTWATHVIEIPLTFLVFGNAFCRWIAFVSFVGLSVMINVSGNYGFLGMLTTVQCFSLLDNDVLWYFLIPNSFLKSYSSTNEIGYFVWTISFLPMIPYYALSLVPLRSTFHGKVPWGPEIIDFIRSLPILRNYAVLIDSWVVKVSKLYNQYSPFRTSYWKKLEEFHMWTTPFSIINRYAKFGSMSTKRRELIIQGSDDGQLWFEYEFKYKPGNINQRPPTIPGHLPALDWFVWFIPPRVIRNGLDALPAWYFELLKALLEGRKDITDLMGRVPEIPPKYIKTLLYNYTIPDSKLVEDTTKLETGTYWQRELMCEVHRPITLAFFARKNI